MFPAIHNWHCRINDRQKEQSPVYLSAQNASQLLAAHEWTIYTADAAKIPSLAYPFYLHPWGDSYQKVVDVHPFPGGRSSWIYAGMLIAPDGQFLTDLEYQ